MMELTSYQVKLLFLLNQPGKPRYTEQELLSLGIEYDRDEFIDLINNNYIRRTKREPRRENEYFITPNGEKAITSYLKKQAEIEKNDKFNSDTLEVARRANQLAEEANKKAKVSNAFSAGATIISLSVLVWEIIKIFIFS